MTRWNTWGDDAAPDYDESDRYDDRAERTCNPTLGEPCGECSACGGEGAGDGEGGEE